MTLAEHLRASRYRYRYVGTVWGTDQEDGTGEHFAQMLESCDYDGEITEIGDGYWVESKGDVWWYGDYEGWDEEDGEPDQKVLAVIKE